MRHRCWCFNFSDVALQDKSTALSSSRTAQSERACLVPPSAPRVPAVICSPAEGFKCSQAGAPPQSAG